MNFDEYMRGLDEYGRRKVSKALEDARKERQIEELWGLDEDEYPSDFDLDEYSDYDTDFWGDIEDEWGE